MNNKIIISLFAAGISFMSATSAMASASSSLGDCYNLVISACNETAHPVPCSENAMDECDDLHANKMVIDPNKFKTLRAPGNPSAARIQRSR